MEKFAEGEIKYGHIVETNAVQENENLVLWAIEVLRRGV
jgi:hypothetical protein